MIVTAVIGVLVISALLAWGMLRVAKSSERAERDPRYLRRLLFRGGALYIVTTVFGIVGVATGREPVQTLFGLPIVLLIIWLLLRAASRVKIPPA